MSESKSYPYTGWVLTPSFVPKEVVLTRPYGTWSGGGCWDATDSGKSYHVEEIYATKAGAIDHGFALLDKQQADLAKRQSVLDKRRLNLQKAKGAAPRTQAGFSALGCSR